MKIMYLTIRNGAFASVKGEYDEMTRDKAIGNGWNCEILGDGKIRCVTSGFNGGEMCSMTYTIQPDGFARLVYRKESEKIPTTLKKGYVIKKGDSLTGVICLVNADKVSMMKAFFRDEAFQGFLDKYKLDTVRQEAPNQTYVLNFYSSELSTHWDYLYTDGIIIEEAYGKENLQSGKKRIKVTGARWVVIRRMHIYKKEKGQSTTYNSILYTLGNPMRLDLTKSLGNSSQPKGK